jgi:phosphoserine aminotransferase
MGRVFNWIKKQGGLPAIGRVNEEKARLLYSLLDSSDFWRPNIRPDSRSIMNVTFRLATEELENKLAKEATAAGFAGIKGHRSAGGLRASIYNAVTLDNVASFVDFLKEFERKNG